MRHLPNVQIVAAAAMAPAAVAAATRHAELVVIDLDTGTGGVEVLRTLREPGFARRIVVLSDRADGAHGA